ncbi:hypothetical protein LCGC14_0322990 [marine sediment metagenome]|uniref:Uncharacterized protein n=1 Tax=marine sediment metagenome TaxID=412755 RepID=A0A0F9TIJ1_9ZZZZ
MTATKMKSLCLTGPEVRTLLKTGKLVQFVVMEDGPTGPCRVQWDQDALEFSHWDTGYEEDGVTVACPFAPGERRWVREAWAIVWTKHEPDEGQTIWDVPHRIEYKADSDAKYPGNWPDDCGDDEECPRWQSPMHMPRRASRLTVEVVAVEAMQIQEASETDVRQMGLAILPETVHDRPELWAVLGESWDAAHAKPEEKWDANPWCWKVTHD